MRTDSIDKHKLIANIRQQLEKDLLILKEAAQATYEAATNEESRPENQYDTRALEASYLARAQAERVLSIEQMLTIFKYAEIKNFDADSAISSSALVEVELNKNRSFVFILSKGGGLMLNFNDHPVQIVTPTSPLGEALIGLKSGDTSLVEIGNKTREYKIISVR